MRSSRIIACSASFGMGVSMLLALAHSQTQDISEAARQVEQAQQYLAQQAFDKARQSALKVAKLAPDSAALQQRAAEILYRAGDSRQSLKLFNRVVELAPRQAAHNWQRGIALCSCGEFALGAEQFKTHHDVNPDDVENSAWYFLCVAKQQGIEAARRTVIPSRGDGRQPMMSVLQMLKGEIEPEQVTQAAIKNTRAGPHRDQAQFYADLYIGLYYDSQDQPQQAKKFLTRSLSYGNSGYMVDVARVYLADRFPMDNLQK